MSWWLAIWIALYNILRLKGTPMPYRSVLSSSIKRFEIIGKWISGFLDALAGMTYKT
ncbi:hypothetical protein [Nitrosospira briensis]|uniref:hypothetical protein n=1 Tax=Nitrosospira briensis TaxID=35799 RepID=UPI0018D12E9D|nr:hypothetical protein [Nitrosospira briensis]